MSSTIPLYYFLCFFVYTYAWYSTAPWDRNFVHVHRVVKEVVLGFFNLITMHNCKSTQGNRRSIIHSSFLYYFRVYKLIMSIKEWSTAQIASSAKLQNLPTLLPHFEHRFLAPFARLCQIWLRHWRGTLYLRAAVHRRGQRPPKGSDTDIKTVEAAYSAQART